MGHAGRPEGGGGLSTTPDRKRCPHCTKVKPLGAFHRRGDGRPQSWCKVCTRADTAMRSQTPEYRAWQAAYLARPEVKARRAENDARRREKRRAQRKLYRATARGKLTHCRRQACRKLRVTTDPDRRARLERLIACYAAEIARMDASLACGGRKAVAG